TRRSRVRIAITAPGPSTWAWTSAPGKLNQSVTTIARLKRSTIPSAIPRIFSRTGTAPAMLQKVSQIRRKPAAPGRPRALASPSSRSTACTSLSIADRLTVHFKTGRSPSPPFDTQDERGHLNALLGCYGRQLGRSAHLADGLKKLAQAGAALAQAAHLASNRAGAGGTLRVAAVEGEIGLIQASNAEASGVQI